MKHCHFFTIPILTKEKGGNQNQDVFGWGKGDTPLFGRPTFCFFSLTKIKKTALINDCMYHQRLYLHLANSLSRASYGYVPLVCPCLDLQWSFSLFVISNSDYISCFVSLIFKRDQVIISFRGHLITWSLLTAMRIFSKDSLIK